jgi:hypothetical protein
MRRAIVRSALLLLSAAAFACAGQPKGGSTGPVDEDTGDSQEGPPSTTPTKPSADPPADPPPPPPAADAGTRPDASRGNPDDTSIASLFPAVVGHSWTLDVTSDFPQCAGEKTGSVLGQQKVDGRDALWISSYCDGQPPAAVSVSDRSADVDVQGKYIPQLAEPVVEGATFASIMGQTTWHKERSPVTVPAGTFDNCWRAVAGSNFVVYCPGVGTVHIHEVHNGGVIDAILKAKNF